MSSSDTAKLKNDFLAWLQDFKIDCVSDCDTLPSEFAALFHSYKLRPMWQFLMKHVKNEETAQKITKNIALQNLRSENQTLRQSCNEMSDELAELNLSLQRLEEKVNQKRLRCVKSSMITSKKQENVDCNYLKSLFHEQCSGNVNRKRDVLDAQNYAFKQATNLQHQNEDAVNDKQQFYSCRDELKKLLMSIHKHFLRANEGNGDPTHTPDSWKTALAILKQYHPKLLVDALALITQHDAEKLAKKESTTRNNVTKSEVADSPLKTIQKMMEEHHEESLNEFQEASKCEAAAEKLNKSNARSLRLLFDDLPTTSHQSQMRDILETEMCLTGEEAYLKSLQASVQTLKHEIDSNAQSQQEVAAMQREMKDFNKELAKNKVKIIEATRQNTDFLRSFSQTQKEILDLADEILQPKQEKISELNSAFEEVIRDEQSSLYEADISKLQTAEIIGKNIPVKFLAIHRQSNDSYECGDEFYQEVLFLLGIHTSKWPSDVLRHITERYHDLKFAKSLDDSVKELLPRESKKVNEIEGVLDESRSHIEKHSNKMSEWIKRGEKAVAVLNEGEAKLNDTLTEWYEQPAYQHADWLQVDGKSFKKWKEAVLS